MSDTKREPLLSDYNMRRLSDFKVRDYYERLIDEGKLRVVEEVEEDRSIAGFVACECAECDVREGVWECYNYCPGCGGKIKRA